MVDGLRMLGWTSAVGLLALAVTGCAKRDTGTIDVDAIQRQVDTIEGHIKGMRVAIKNKDLDEAEDRYQEAAEEYGDHREQLAAYPEVSLLTGQLEQAAGDLCYAFVDINLQRFFDAVRAEDVDAAREQLERSQQEFERCRKKIEHRDDFVALKMNLESAPRSLATLKEELARKRRLAHIKEIEQELAPRLASVRRKVAALENNPNQRALARKTDAAIKALEGALGEHDAFGEDPDWVAVAGEMRAALEDLDRRRAACVRRGKILWAVENLLPQASKKATMAVTTRDPEAKLDMVKTAHQSYQECEALTREAIREEPGLAKFTFTWRGSRRTAVWLRKHCMTNRRITARMIAKLTGKRPPTAVPKKPDAAKKPDPKNDEKPASKKKKRRRRRRRGRIRRW